MQPEKFGLAYRQSFIYPKLPMIIKQSRVVRASVTSLFGQSHNTVLFHSERKSTTWRVLQPLSRRFPVLQFALTVR